MARKPKIWFREQDGYYYTTYKGEQTKLDKDFKEAEKAFHNLLGRPDEQPTKGFRPSFKKLADQYLDFTKQTKSERTYSHQLYFLQLFCDHIKGKRAADLKPGDVTAWLLKINADGQRRKDRFASPPVEGKPKWGHNTQVTARGLVVACLNWAVTEGHLPFSPLARMKVGQMHGRERILSKDERERIKAATPKDDFYDLIVFLEQTGARPFSEGSQVTASMIDWEEGSITLKKHKNARKGKSRVVYLTAEAQEVLKRLCAKRPEGPLFLTRRGVPYNKGNVNQRIRRLEKKLGIPRFNLYSYRHSYITDALERGLSSDVVAELVGNTPKTITKYYAHLDKKKDLR